jgi:hypothetical protein
MSCSLRSALVSERREIASFLSEIDARSLDVVAGYDSFLGQRSIVILRA